MTRFPTLGTFCLNFSNVWKIRGSVFAVLVLCLSAPAASVDELLALTEKKRGICVVVGGDGQRALELAQKSEFLVLGRVDSATPLDGIISKAADEGLLNKRLYLSAGDLNVVPLADHYVDLLIVEGTVSPEGKELMRALSTPGGVAHWVVTGKTFKTRKPVAGTDDWGHWYHAPDNNPVSTDSVLVWPYLTQWMDRPYYGAQARTTVVSAGRVFSATGSAGGPDKLSDQWNNRHLLQARSAFNGMLLWDLRLDENYPVSRSTFIAMPDIFYMIEGSDVLMLNPDTGEEDGQIDFSGVGESLNWIVIQDGILYAMAGEAQTPWKEVKFGLQYKYPVPTVNRRLDKFWGFGKRLAAYDLQARAQLWTHETPDLMDGRKLAVGDGNIFYATDTQAGCIEGQTGKVLWTQESQDYQNGMTAVMDEYILTRDVNSLGTTRPGLLYTPLAVYIRVQHMANMVALSSKDGSLLWSKPARGKAKSTRSSKIGIHSFWLNDKLCFNDSTHVPETGEFIEPLESRSSGCGPVTVSPGGFYSRHSIGFDRIRNLPVYDYSFRSGCWQDAIPANGLLISGPYLCACNYQLSGYVVLAPAGDMPFDRTVLEKDRLETVSTVVSGLTVDASDWSTYRANSHRSTSTSVDVPALASQKWTAEASHSFEPLPPVTAGGLVFVAGNDGRIVCFDNRSGKQQWVYWTGSKIFSAPTIAEGRVFVGSSDGNIYCLDAREGSLLWRFRTGPVERRYMAFGHLVSTWPVNSGVLYDNGTVYAAAGIVDRDGTYVYALDAQTGKIKWQNVTSGHLDPGNHKGVSANGHIAIGAGRLWLPSGSVASPASYDLATGECTVPSYFTIGKLNGKMGKGSGPRGSEIGIIQDKVAVYGGRMLYSDQNYRPKLSGGMDYAFNTITDGILDYPEVIPRRASVLSPAWDDQQILSAVLIANGLECWNLDGTLDFLEKEKGFYIQPKRVFGQAVINMGGRAKPRVHPMQQWRTEKLEMYAFALAGNAAVVLSGDGDRTAYAPLYSEKWALNVFDRADGSLLWEQPLPSEPLLNGLCIARDGGIIVTLRNGTTVCYQ